MFRNHVKKKKIAESAEIYGSPVRKIRRQKLLKQTTIARIPLYGKMVVPPMDDHVMTKIHFSMQECLSALKPRSKPRTTPSFAHFSFLLHFPGPTREDGKGDSPYPARDVWGTLQSVAQEYKVHQNASF